ncbi:MAG: DUF2339 domain-containing protein [Deltaproteobacteria bacterium]|nr:DUF2339 domain-containing protein [Deltaproteobacteria bacterium]MBW2417961.1 DUF2339 domain-containing protein [Deltaproteobacteria bacterium]
MPGHSRRANNAETGGSGLAIILGLLGFVIGSGLARDAGWGAISGLCIGLLLAAWRTLSQRAARFAAALEEAELRLADLERRFDVGAVPAAEAASTEAPSGATPSPTPSSTASPTPSPTPPRDPRPKSTQPRRPVRRRAPREPGPVARAAVFARELLFGGNTVVRVGVGVLLVGVALLAKWAADHALFPVELRLAAASAIGVALTAVGFRLRDARPGFATTLQGGGVAALYLVVFAAFRSFDLVPAGMAFALFGVIAAACGTLAVAQRSQPLIFIGSLGGFLAPLLSSTGADNHVVLFSYYLVLNIAIAAVAWFRSWRPLNLLAFVCTYGVATVWGVLRYRPENFATTEPFLLAFMLLFTAEALFFAWRREPKLRGLVDGTLVFGTPLVTLLAQARLVADMELGMAWSAAGFGLFYAGIATWLWKTAPETLRRLSEACVALALGFGTMAIPFAFQDGLSTAIAWSLEGAGVYWVGARQGRRLGRVSGIGLQGLAALALALSGGLDHAPGSLAIVNNHFLPCLALAGAGLFIAREAWALRSVLGEHAARISQLLGVWGLFWWAIGIGGEIDRFVASPYQAASLVTLIGVSALALERSAALLAWKPGRLLALAALPAALLAIPAALDDQPHLFAHGGALAWPFCVAAIYLVVRRVEGEGPAWLRLVHGPALWLVALVTAIGLQGFAAHGMRLDGDWPLAAYGLGLALAVMAALLLCDREGSLMDRHRDVILAWGLGPLIALLLLWFQLANFAGSGDARPLPYLPILNPLDLSLLIATLATLSWWAAAGHLHRALQRGEAHKLAVGVLCAMGFVFLNGILARSVHQWAGVPMRADALWDSAPLQVSLSIAWTLLALAGMTISTRHGWRAAWLGSAALIGVVVVKLFTVDLSQLGTPAKIGTFLIVGVLLLVVGFVSPVPPEAGPPEGAGDDRLPEEPAHGAETSELEPQAGTG